MDIFLLYWIFLQVCGLASAEWNYIFLKDLLSHHVFYTDKYNVLVCDESEKIKLIKVISANLQRFVAVRRADKTLTPFTEEPQTFVLNLQCAKATEILQQAEQLSLFGKPFRWLLLNDDEDYNIQNENGTSLVSGNIWSLLETLSIFADSNVNIVQRDSNDKIAVTGAYKLPGKFIKEPLAEWTKDGGLIVLNTKPLAIRRWDLQGTHMNTSTVLTHDESWDHLEDLVDIHIDTTSKVCYNILKFYEDMFNISIHFHIVKEWGVLNNGSWTGMVAQLEKKEIEFGTAPLFFQKERLHIVEYYATITPSRLSFIFLAPPLSYSSNIFVMPFDTIVWFCCFAMVGISCFFLFTALNYEKTHRTEEEKNEDEDRHISFSEIVVLNIGAICLQGTVAQTKNPPGRIITLFLYLAYVFLNISYSASIVAILQSSDTSIQTLSDFLRSPLKAGAEDVTYNRYYFRKAEDEVRRSLYLKKIVPKNEPPHFLTVEDGIKKVQEGFYGFFVELTTGYQMVQKTFTEEEKCALQQLKEEFLGFIDPWIVMKKKSPYAEHFKIAIKRSIERGFKSRFVQRYYTEKPICGSKSARFVSVGMIDCYYAFMLLTSGVITAFFIMILEISFSPYLKRMMKRLRGRRHNGILSITQNIIDNNYNSGRQNSHQN